MRVRFSVPIIVAAFLAAFWGLGGDLRAQEPSMDELRQEIETKNEEIKKLEEEAEKYRKELETTQERGDTLSAELKRIDRTIQQLRRDINLNETKIKKADLEIRTLAVEITDKEKAVSKLRSGIGGLLRALVEQEQQPLIAALIHENFLSDFLRQFDYFANAQARMLESVERLRSLRQGLSVKKEEAQDKKNEAEYLRGLLASRRAAVNVEKKDRQELLRDTKNKEKEYQELVEDLEERRRALSEEVREIEDKIRVTIDPASLPSKGSGVLGWPLPNVLLGSCWERKIDIKEKINCITQYFGYTSFAKVGGYGGKGHNGLDLRAQVGTPVFATEGGIVKAVGDTDLGCRRASYGKWILIDHPNNLSTLYAHLADISISAGKEVGRGERIGLSGQTGFATGPHLHFAVFATPAVRIESIRSRVCRRLMTLPLAAVSGYLDPLDYL